MRQDFLSHAGELSRAHGDESIAALHFEERTFHDTLYDWMERAPWLAVSGAAHLLVFFILMSIPWSAFRREEPPIVNSGVVAVPDEKLEEPVEPPQDVELLAEEIPDPVPLDAELPLDTPDEFDSEEFSEVENDFLHSFGEPNAALNELGLGGPPGHLGNRGGGKGPGSKGGGGTQPSVLAGLEWLARHQHEDGSWDGDGFDSRCPTGDVCSDPGHATHDVGLTGLALLAFLGVGSDTRSGQYRDTVARGIRWLIQQQDKDTGLVGPASHTEYMYDHAIATLALCEAFGFALESPWLRSPAQRAVHFIQRARNPYSAWRYEAPADGTSDSSVTGWMVFALAAAEDAGLEVDAAAFDAALAWFDQVTDESTGRCGYMQAGELSSRTPANRHFPSEKGEALTAVALLSRFFCGQEPEDHPIMEKHAELLRRSPPTWDPEGFGCDMYYWYYGSYAMFQMGGRDYWEPWNRALKRAVVDSQCKDGDAAGSWDPVGPWGHVGGRVYSTALMTLCLEVYYRYPRLIGTR